MIERKTNGSAKAFRLKKVETQKAIFPPKLNMNGNSPIAIEFEMESVEKVMRRNLNGNDAYSVHIEAD